MRRLDMWMMAVAVLAMAAFAGCPSGAKGPSSPNNGGSTSENSNAQDENNDPATADGLLTAEEAAAVTQNTDFVERVAGTFATLAAADLPPLTGGPVVEPVPVPTCPTLAITVGRIVIDFGTNGCVSTLYPDITYSGAIQADVNVQERTLVLTFNELGVQLEGLGLLTVTGTADGAANQDDGMILLGATLELVFHADATTLAVAGDLTFNADLTTGEMVIMTADLTTTDETGQTNVLELSQVHLDPAEHGNLVPDSGTVNLRLGTEGPGSVSIVITFSENTPIDGSVFVSVNGSPAVSMGPEGS